MEGQHLLLDSDGILVRDPSEIEAGAKPYEVSHFRHNNTTAG